MADRHSMWVVVLLIALAQLDGPQWLDVLQLVVILIALLVFAYRWAREAAASSRRSRSRP